jgi:hypothetical protein
VYGEPSSVLARQSRTRDECHKLTGPVEAGAVVAVVGHNRARKLVLVHLRLQASNELLCLEKTKKRTKSSSPVPAGQRNAVFMVGGQVLAFSITV